MPLLERIGTLLRANLNDLLDKAEDPEKLCKQLVLDMENQLMQVKTQVAMAMADQHLLSRRLKEQQSTAVDWRRKAEIAVGKNKDDLARAALQRSLESERMAAAFSQQLDDQSQEAELLRGAYSRLERKLSETRNACEMLAAQNRRAKAANRLNASQNMNTLERKRSAVVKLKDSVERMQAENFANHLMLEPDSVDSQFESIERVERVEQLLAELKSQHRLA